MTTPQPVVVVETKPYKAIIAFVITFATALYATLQGKTDLEGMKLIDWAIVILGAFVTAGAVWLVRNPVVAR